MPVYLPRSVGKKFLSASRATSRAGGDNANQAQQTEAMIQVLGLNGLKAAIGDRLPNRVLMGPWSHEEEVETFRGDEERLRIGLVPFRLVPADDRLEEMADAQPRER